MRKILILTSLIFVNFGLIFSDISNRYKIFGAIKEGNKEALEKIIKGGGYDPSYTYDDSQDTPLILAVIENKFDLVKLLVDQPNQNIDVKNRYGETALWHAAQGGYTDIVKLLLQKGANVNIKDLFNRTALMEAAVFGSEEIVKLLLEKGADVNAQDESGETALIEASKRGREKIVELLLEKGAEPRIKDKEGKTAEYYAKEKGYEEISKMLRVPWKVKIQKAKEKVKKIIK